MNKVDDILLNTDDDPLDANHDGIEDVVAGRLNNNSDSSNSSLPSKTPVLSVACQVDESQITQLPTSSTHSSRPELFGIAEMTADCGDSNSISNDATATNTTSSNINRRLKKADLLLNSFMDKIPLRKMTLNSPLSPTKTPVNSNSCIKNNGNSDNKTNNNNDNISNTNNNIYNSSNNNQSNTNNNNKNNNNCNDNNTGNTKNNKSDYNLDNEDSIIKISKIFDGANTNNDSLSDSNNIDTTNNKNNVNITNNNNSKSGTSGLPEFQVHQCDGPGKKIQ